MILVGISYDFDSAIDGLVFLRRDSFILMIWHIDGPFVPFASFLSVLSICGGATRTAFVGRTMYLDDLFP